jgi:hypothetical protein
MLHDVYYIIPPAVMHLADVECTDCILAWQIDLNQEAGHKAVYQAACQLQENIQFTLCILNAETVTGEIATEITAFFFFSNFNKHLGNPCLLLQGNESENLTAGMQQLAEHAKLQGFVQIQPILLKVTKDSSAVFFQASQADIIRQSYKSWLYNPMQDDINLYINISAQEDITRIQALLQEEERLFRQQNEGLFHLKRQNKDLTKQVQELERFSNAAKQEISNQVMYNDLLRSQSQVAALQKYYDNEYEILPLWYKRVGHVVKVLMGKRSFKSIFRNNVKKYIS